MGWEERNGNRYYYRKRREGDRVRSEYVGAGGVALAYALARVEDRRAARATAAALDALFRTTDDACGRLMASAVALLEAAGFHRHKRQWRRRRMTTTQLDLPQSQATGLPPALPATGDGDLGRIAREFVCRAALGGETCDEELLARVKASAERVKDRAAGPNPTVIEELLAERVGINWVAVHVLDMGAFTNGPGRDASDKHLSRAHHRYISSLRSLAAVRKLDLTAIQINLAPGQGGL